VFRKLSGGVFNLTSNAVNGLAQFCGVQNTVAEPASRAFVGVEYWKCLLVVGSTNYKARYQNCPVCNGKATMAERRFLVRFKIREMPTQPVIASTVQIQGDHLVFLDSDGKLVALLLMVLVESWSESEL
jgi:hypothetical protein